MATVAITYFSDVLCVWAYIAQLRVDEVKSSFKSQVSFEHRFCPIFGDTARKIATQWGKHDGYDRFNVHLLHSAAAFPELTLDTRIWRATRPASSTGAHVFLKAVQIAETRGLFVEGTAERVLIAFRAAFFEQAQDIARWEVQCAVAFGVGVDVAVIEPMIRDGSAYAALAADYQDAEKLGVQGSPTFVLNDGRQKLYGNVGYRIIEANIQELLRDPHPDQASWC
jgi:predicted DsbA family dithiol-disulfide isomerase